MVSPRLGVRLTPAALKDIQGARRWYNDRSPGLGDEFLDSSERAFGQLAESPRTWPPYYHETRRYLLHRFPFAVIYRLKSDFTEIAAVAHGRRKPGY